MHGGRNEAVREDDPAPLWELPSGSRCGAHRLNGKGCCPAAAGARRLPWPGAAPQGAGRLRRTSEVAIDAGPVVLLRRREALGLMLLVVAVLVVMAQCGLLGEPIVARSPCA
jgi:hypothetical protein